MPRILAWLPLALGWVPVWALFVTLLLTAHPGTTPIAASVIALRLMSAAAVMGLFVHRLTRRVPWPDRFAFPFLLVHIAAAVAYALAWFLLNSVIESVLRGQMVMVIGNGIGPFLILGVWMYGMIAGVSYASQATDRAVRAEALAARSQLAALRAQLNPHFLFNALHTVVQLIPREPERASRAAEQVASLLRTTIEEDRDLVTVQDEWRFVERYVAIESMRFGDRLIVKTDIAPEAFDQLVPSYCIQTLVENAVRHGAAPNIHPTTIDVSVKIDSDRLHIRVSDNGVGVGAPSDGGYAEHVRGANTTEGTGLPRLRERLGALFGSTATLATTVGVGGFTADVFIPAGADA